MKSGLCFFFGQPQLVNRKNYLGDYSQSRACSRKVLLTFGPGKLLFVYCVCINYFKIKVSAQGTKLLFNRFVF